jgi:hypothetical protein
MKPGSRALVIGGAAQDKSVLLQYCAVVAARRFLAREADSVPLLVAVRALGPTRGRLASRLAAIVSEWLGQVVGDGELVALAIHGRLVLLVDGLDEAHLLAPDQLEELRLLTKGRTGVSESRGAVSPTGHRGVL